MRGTRGQGRDVTTAMRTRRTPRLGLAVAAIAGLASLGLAACGDSTTVTTGDEGAATTLQTDGPPTGGAALPAGDELLLRVDVSGGFVPIETALSHLPQLSVYGDGLVLQPAPMIMIYPGPALPGLNAAALDEDGVAAVEAAIAASGLAADPPDYGQPPIADAPDTRVTITVDGTTYEHVANALGMGGGWGPYPARPDDEGEEPLPGLSPDQQAARDRLAAFVEEVGDLTRLFGAGHLSDPVPWQPERYRLWAQPASDVPAGTVADPAPEPAPTSPPATAADGTGLDPDTAVSSPEQPTSDGRADDTASSPVQPAPDDGSDGTVPGEPRPRLWAWPIEEVDLAAVGQCLVVEGDVADAVGALFSQADQLTRFEQAGVAYAVVVRPLLPDEPGCPEGS